MAVYIAYHTNYRIIDTKSKKVLWTNSNQSCFKEYATGGPKELKYNKNNTIEILILKSRLSIKPEIEEWYLNKLKTIGIKIKVKDIVTSYSDNKYIDDIPSHLREYPGEYRIYYLDQKNYLNKTHVKFGCYLIRLCWEDHGFRYLEDLKKLCDENPKASFISLLYYQNLYRHYFRTGNDYYTAGHGAAIFRLSDRIYKPFTNKSFKEYFKTLDDQFYDNNCTTDFENKVLFKHVIKEGRELNRQYLYKEKIKVSSYQDYLDLFKL